MTYQIEYSSEAVKQLKKMDPSTRLQILKRLEKLAENPHLAKPLSNIFKNYKSERIGKHRIVFSIVQNTIVLAKIEHRDTVYD